MHISCLTWGYSYKMENGWQLPTVSVTIIPKSLGLLEQEKCSLFNAKKFTFFSGENGERIR